MVKSKGESSVNRPGRWRHFSSTSHSLLYQHLRGHTKPERASYLIWTIVNALTIASYISVGATTTIWNGLVLSFTGFMIFLLSTKYGLGGFSKFDISCLFLALGGAAIWAYSANPVIALYYLTFVGAIGFLPTVKKTYFLPKTENSLSWTLTMGASYLNFFALTSLHFKFVFPLVCTAILQSMVVILILLPSLRFKHIQRNPHKVPLFLKHPMFAK
jgi:hypothetical protein